jgi:RecQ family ATP-dependent DNA helicase
MNNRRDDHRRDDPETIDLCIDSEDDTPLSKQSSTSSSFFSLRSRPFGSLSSRELSLYCLQRVFGFQSFRPGVQADVVQTCVDKPKSDIFVIMPTGGGKSICYAVPALLHPGVTVVVSPLLSLIQDQVTGFVSGSSSLQGHGIAAAHLSSEMTEAEAVTLYRELFKAKNFPPRTADAIASSRVPQYPPIQLLPTCKLLFCTPEKLAKSSTLNEALLALYEGRHPVTNQRLLARFVIDEAHCVSEWGHDFRKDYLELSRLRRDFPDVQIMALTATATPTVRDDISRVLGMKNVSNFEQSFNRTNLIYSVRKKRNVKSERESNGLQGKEALYAQVLDYITKEHGPTDVGIIYSLSRDDCEDLAIWLKLMGISADYYHAGMPSKQRVIVQNAWQSGKTRIIVATIAYGMGIDMPSVRFVVHFTIAKSVEGYFQESGRAGRDGQLAHCLLFYDKKDVDRVSRLLNMPQKGKTRATMAREEARLKQMQQFCEDTNKCRREFMINFFGQEFNKALCKGTCDNCYAASTFSSSSSSSSTMMSAMSKKEKEWLRNHDKDALPSLPKEIMASRMSIARSSGKGGSKAATSSSSGVKEGEIEKTSDDPFSDIFGGKKKTKSLSSSSSGRVSKKRARSKTPTDNGNDDANDIHVGVGKPKTKKKKNFWAGKNFWKSKGKSQGKKTKGIIYQRK